MGHIVMTVIRKVAAPTMKMMGIQINMQMKGY